jgi:hypothetical protein
MRLATIICELAHAPRATLCGGPIWLCRVLAADCFPIAAATSQKSPQSPTTGDISDPAPENLMNIDANLAANKEQSLSEMGAALCVITREDMASSGANNQVGRMTWRC